METKTAVNRYADDFIETFRRLAAARRTQAAEMEGDEKFNLVGLASANKLDEPAASYLDLREACVQYGRWLFELPGLDKNPLDIIECVRRANVARLEQTAFGEAWFLAILSAWSDDLITQNEAKELVGLSALSTISQNTALAFVYDLESKQRQGRRKVFLSQVNEMWSLGPFAAKAPAEEIDG